MCSQAVAGDPQDVRAVEEPLSRALTNDNEGLYFNITIYICEFLCAIFHFPVGYLQCFRKCIIGLDTEFFDKAGGTCIG
jgi:hypothetical protein